LGAKTKIRALETERVSENESLVGCRGLCCRRRAIRAADRGFFRREHADELAVRALIFEAHHAGDGREEAIVLGAADVLAGLVARAALTDENAAAADELAAKTLALTGQYASLVEVLAQVPHDEAVEAAARGLRAWLPIAPNNVTLLQKELSTAFVPAVEDIVLRLLWGYNINDDARNLDTSKQLVEWLDNDKLAVRVLAIDQISALTGGQTMRYRAGMKTADRKVTKRQWEHYVEQNKGLVHK